MFLNVCRSAVNSSTDPPKARQNFSVFDHTQVTEKSSTDVRVAEKTSGTIQNISRPPHRVHAGTGKHAFTVWSSSVRCDIISNACQ